jgi:starvation-inducible outer membrane lipoprotein
MKTTALTLIAFGALALAGCASAPPAPEGMKVGQFVTYKCADGKQFQARLAEGGASVRVRYEGGWELDRKDAGVYEAEGWKLMTQGPTASELIHGGKTVLKNCRPA